MNVTGLRCDPLQIKEVAFLLSIKDSPWFSLFGGKHMNPTPRFPEDSAQRKAIWVWRLKKETWKGMTWHCSKENLKMASYRLHCYTSIWQYVSVTFFHNKKRCQLWMTKQDSARPAAQCPDQWQPKLSAIFSHLQATVPSWQRSEIPEAWSTPGHRRIANHQLEWFHAQW